MARIRTIKPEFWTSEQVMECSTNARLLFIGLWNFCDDAGRMVASSKRIKASVFPSDDLTADDIRRMIDELASNDLVMLYVVDDKEYLQVTGWHHQKIDRAQNSRLPDPPDPHSPNGRRTFGVGREGKGRDSKGRESPGGGGSPPAPAHAREAPTRHEADGNPAEGRAEQSAAAPPAWNTRANFDRIEARCRAVLPGDWVQDPVVGPMARLEADGLDLEREIVPTIIDLVASRRVPIRTWRILADAVSERVAIQRQSRIADGLSPVPKAAPPPAELIDMHPHGQWPETTIRQWVARHRDSPASWNESVFGPAPGVPGCKVPARLLIGEAA